MRDLFSDVRYGFRMMWKARGFSAVAVISLALGIGFNTTMFSAVDALLLRPKGGSDLESLVEVYLSDSSGYPYAVSSYPDLREYRERTDAFEGIASHQTTIASFRHGGSSEYLLGEIVSGNFFQVLGIRPLRGRTLEPGDDVTPGGHPVILVSETFWRGRLGGRADAVGGVLELNGRPYTIVGILPLRSPAPFPWWRRSSGRRPRWSTRSIPAGAAKASSKRARAAVSWSRRGSPRGPRWKRPAPRWSRP